MKKTTRRLTGIGVVLIALCLTSAASAEDFGSIAGNEGMDYSGSGSEVIQESSNAGGWQPAGTAMANKPDPGTSVSEDNAGTGQSQADDSGSSWGLPSLGGLIESCKSAWYNLWDVMDLKGEKKTQQNIVTFNETLQKDDINALYSQTQVGIEAFPNSAEMWHWAGYANLLKGNNEEAISDYSKAFDLYSAENNQTWMGEALSDRSIAKILTKDYSGALQDAENALTYNPQIAQRADNRQVLGGANWYLGNKDKALEYMNQAVSNAEGNTQRLYDVLSDRMGFNDALKNYDAVIEDGNRILKDCPGIDPMGTAYLMGLAYAGKNDTDKAIEYFTKAIDSTPEGTLNDLIYFNRGNEYFSKQEYAKAVSDYEKVLALVPDVKVAKTNLAQAHLASGNQYYDQGDYASAVSEYSKSSQAENSDAAQHNLFLACFQEGNQLFNSGELEKAGGYYQAALKINPSSTEVSNNLALVFNRLGYDSYQKGDFSKARDSYYQLTLLQPGNSDAKFNVGLSSQQAANTYFNSGEYGVAASWYRTALDYIPDDPSIKNSLILADIKTGNQEYNAGNYESAINIFSEALQLDPGNNGIANLLSMVNQRQHGTELEGKISQLEGALSSTQSSLNAYKTENSVIKTQNAQLKTALDKETRRADVNGDIALINAGVAAGTAIYSWGK